MTTQPTTIDIARDTLALVFAGIPSERGYKLLHDKYPAPGVSVADISRAFAIAEAEYRMTYADIQAGIDSLPLAMDPIDLAEAIFPTKPDPTKS